MASTIKVDNIQDSGGNSYLSSDGAGTFTTSNLGIDNTPSFYAIMSSNQNGIADDTFAKIQFNSESWDTDSAYDPTTNYRFTVPSGEAGKYFFQANCYLQAATANGSQVSVRLIKNGNNTTGSYGTETIVLGGSDNYIAEGNYGTTAIMNLSVGDYVEVYAKMNLASGNWNALTNDAFFTGYKLIGV
jgi:hypothetical protein